MMSRSEAPADGCGRTVAWLALLSALSIPLATRAQSGAAIELEWHAPPGCPRAAEVLERIEALAGPSKPSGTALRAAATIERSAGRLRLKLVVRWGQHVGERSIEGSSCDDLAGATAVNIALLLRSAEPDAASAPLDSAPETSGVAPAGTTPAPGEPNAPPLPAAEEASESRPEPADAERSTSRPHALVRLPVGSLAFAALPGLSAGASLGAGLALGPYRLIADATYWLRRRLTSDERPAVGARLDRVDARLRACRAFAFGQFELAPCVQLSLSHVWARGTGVNVRAQTAETTWIGAGAGAEARLLLAPWLALFAAFDARLESARPRISVDGAGAVERLGPVTVLLSAGTEWIL